MLNRETIDDLRDALKGLRSTDTAAAWPAIVPLHRLGQRGLSVAIDFSASEAVGATVLVATPEAMPLSLAKLTPRRREVATMLLAGASNKHIARQLHITVGTVKDHVHAILTTLGFPSRSAMIAAAVPKR